MAKKEEMTTASTTASEKIATLQMEHLKIAPHDGPKLSQHSRNAMSRILIDLFAGLLVGAFLGWQIDKYLNTLPFMIFLFSTLGMAGGWYSCFKDWQRNK